MMGHGKHDNCVMCRMGKAVGMIEKHPDDCNCETNTKKRVEQKSQSKDRQFANADLA